MSGKNDNGDDANFLFNTVQMNNSNDHFLTTNIAPAVPGTNPDAMNSIRDQSYQVHLRALASSTLKQHVPKDAKKRKLPVIDLSSSPPTGPAQPNEEVIHNYSDDTAGKNKKQKTNEHNTFTSLQDLDLASLADPADLVQIAQDFGDLDGLDELDTGCDLVDVDLGDWGADMNDGHDDNAPTNNNDNNHNNRDIHDKNGNDKTTAASSLFAVSGDDEFSSLLSNMWTADDKPTGLNKKPHHREDGDDRGGASVEDGEDTTNINPFATKPAGPARDPGIIPVVVRCKLCCGIGHNKSQCRYNPDFFPCSVCGIPGHAVHDNCPGRYCHQCLGRHAPMQMCVAPNYTLTEEQTQSGLIPSNLSTYLNIYHAYYTQRDQQMRDRHKMNTRLGKLAPKKQDGITQPIEKVQFQHLMTSPACAHCGSLNHTASACTFDVDLPKNCIVKKKGKTFADDYEEVLGEEDGQDVVEDRDFTPDELDALKGRSGRKALLQQLRVKQKKVQQIVLTHTKCLNCHQYGHSYCDPSPHVVAQPSVVELSVVDEDDEDCDEEKTASADKEQQHKKNITNEFGVVSTHIPVIRLGQTGYKQLCGICGQTNHLPENCYLITDPTNPTLADDGKKLLSGNNSHRFFHIYTEETGLITSRIIKNGFACSICNRQGHVAAKCPNRKCYACNQSGHDKWECPQRSGGGGRGGKPSGGYNSHTRYGASSKTKRDSSTFSRGGGGAGGGGYHKNNGDRRESNSNRHSYGAKNRR